MDLREWIIVVLLLLQEFVKDVSATTCSYMSSTGVRKYTFCMQKCCDEANRSYTNVCCTYDDEKQVYLGAGMATLIVLAIFSICFTYVCCKQRIRQLQTAVGQENRPEELNKKHYPVEPLQPPAYEALPPPYYSVAQGTSNKKEQSSFHDEPPPAYTP